MMYLWSNSFRSSNPLFHAPMIYLLYLLTMEKPFSNNEIKRDQIELSVVYRVVGFCTVGLIFSPDNSRREVK